MKVAYKDLSSLASDVWAAKTLEDKRAKISVLIESMKFKAKAERFKQLVLEADVKKIDKLAADIMLCDTDKVIR